MSFLLKSMVSSQVKNLGLGGGEEEKKDNGAAADPAAAAGMTREEYEEYQKQVVEENCHGIKYLQILYAENLKKKSEQDENAIQMAGDDVDIPEELRKMVDDDTVEEEEKDSILGQIQNIQNMDMDTIKEKAQATFSEMKEAAEQKCTVM
ncbi:Complexin-4 [Acipenser ruthenus]|uniref:Complexin-4 n=1 Tax=Acipenser ruthenus TaxID=7906 RepID=A0A444UZC5_ACIRT|nr:Complexin-4 [Acipenser ruthenus]